MLTKKNKNFFRLLFSSDPRDRIELRCRLRTTPVAGSLLRLAQRFGSAWRQRTPADYARMQKRTYELYASADRVAPGNIDGDYVVGSWRQHNEWPDYDEFLMKYVPRDESWVALDYGCGPGRNIRRWSSIFRRVDGVDISARNLENARAFLQGCVPTHKEPNLYLTDGMNCGAAPKNHYDFAFSTICLQHICVFDVRYAILSSLFDCLKPGGRVSIQMGFGVPSPNTVNYHANHVRATGTNRDCDTAIGSPDEPASDLAKIGFVEFEHWVRPVGPGDTHPNWIFFTARKPGPTT